MKGGCKIILVNNEGKVLLQLRDKGHSYSGSWALFGGHIDGAETPEEALVREIKEEINYSLKSYKLIKESDVKDFGRVYWFYGTIDAKLSELKLGEGDDFNFFTYDEILKLKLAPESKKTLIEYFENKNNFNYIKDYRGTIIEESLENKDVLKKVQILSTKVESIKDKHKTPWLEQWTLHFALIPEKEAENIALEISRSFDKEHTSWYADYRNKTHHYIIFPNKIFYIKRDNVEQYNQAKEYGLSLGIPPYQVDFHPEIKVWER